MNILFFFCRYMTEAFPLLFIAYRQAYRSNIPCQQRQKAVTTTKRHVELL